MKHMRYNSLPCIAVKAVLRLQWSVPHLDCNSLLGLRTEALKQWQLCWESETEHKLHAIEW